MDMMSSFRSLVGFAACAAGAVVMAALGYYFRHKCGHEERRTEAFEGTPVHEGFSQGCSQTVQATMWWPGDQIFSFIVLYPVQIVSSGFLQSSDGHKDTQMDKANPEGCLAKAEEEEDEEEDEVSVVQLNSEELHVLNLEDKVMELEKLLSELHRESEIKSKELEQERQAHRVLKEKYTEMEVVGQNEGLLKSCLDEAEERAKIAVESNAQLERENSNLKNQVKTLHGSVEKLEGELHETQQMCEQILKGQQSELTNLECGSRVREELLFKELEREQKFYCTLWVNYKNTVSCLDEAEERVKIAVESNAQLEYQNSVLLEQRKTLQDSVERLEEQLCETHGKGAKLLKSTLKNENVFLKDRVQTLVESGQTLERQLHETQRLYEEMLSERERERTDHRTLLSQYEHIKGSLAEFQKKAENAQDCRTLEKEMFCKSH
ncbi:tropomyosin-like isoform X3 [Ictalurus furcatus]|uniref:tropomyosin-like isoform X3 n=1 Tax=Ictalurus furcatus TaxID=66913 RepID=UPI002350EACD|nr:tropomyosin-like isoform X3 [Ictalurus furcatus]